MNGVNDFSFKIGTVNGTGSASANGEPVATFKNVTGEIPVGVFTCITGVSGGGKSTLVVDTFYKAASRRLMGSGEVPAPHTRIDGLDGLVEKAPLEYQGREDALTIIAAATPMRGSESP